jgi:hypothetical protein
MGACVDLSMPLESVHLRKDAIVVEGPNAIMPILGLHIGFDQLKNDEKS